MDCGNARTKNPIERLDPCTELVFMAAGRSASRGDANLETGPTETIKWLDHGYLRSGLYGLPLPLKLNDP